MGRKDMLAFVTMLKDKIEKECSDLDCALNILRYYELILREGIEKELMDEIMVF